MDQKKTVNIKVDKERLKDLVTVDEIIGMQEGSLKMVRSVLAKFIWSDEASDWIAESDGVKIIGGLTIRQLEESGKVFLQKAEGNAVPPEIDRT